MYVKNPRSLWRAEGLRGFVGIIDPELRKTKQGKELLLPRLPKLPLPQRFFDYGVLFHRRLGTILLALSFYTL